MAGYAEGRPSWMDERFYPVEERLFAGMNLEVFDVLLVDVGGGRGHDVEKFKETFRGVLGRLVLQDLPGVIENIDNLGASIERVPLGFTTPQPVHGARAYFLHSIMHDWSDAKCVLILQHLSKAMRKGYSKISIHKAVLPDQAADPRMTALDWIGSCWRPCQALNAQKLNGVNWLQMQDWRLRVSGLNLLKVTA